MTRTAPVTRTTPVARTIPRYDTIIVGADSAGCLIANRLTTATRGKRRRVLLLEAGAVRTNHWVQLPVGYYKCNMNPV